MRAQQEGSFPQARRRALTRKQTLMDLVSDFPASRTESKAKFLLLKSLSLWEFVVVAPAKIIPCMPGTGSDLEYRYFQKRSYVVPDFIEVEG